MFNDTHENLRKMFKIESIIFDCVFFSLFIFAFFPRETELEQLKTKINQLKLLIKSHIIAHS